MTFSLYFDAVFKICAIKLHARKQSCQIRQRGMQRQVKNATSKIVRIQVHNLVFLFKLFVRIQFSKYEFRFPAFINENR